MNLDDAVYHVFENEVSGVQNRIPEPDEISHALLSCTDRRRYPLRRIFNDFLPAAVLAAACFVAVVSGVPGPGFARPLASELTRTIPADAGENFIVLMAATGEYFRSADR